MIQNEESKREVRRRENDTERPFGNAMHKLFEAPKMPTYPDESDFLSYRNNHDILISDPITVTGILFDPLEVFGDEGRFSKCDSQFLLDSNTQLSFISVVSLGKLQPEFVIPNFAANIRA